MLHQKKNHELKYIKQILESFRQPFILCFFIAPKKLQL
jgi:hypothetical protein